MIKTTTFLKTASLISVIAAICSCGTTSQSIPSAINSTPAPLVPPQPLVVQPLPQPVWAANDENFSPSSPRLIDLTGDGVLDIVMGEIQNSDGASAVVAINGNTGQEMWRNRESIYMDLFASAVFLDINRDSTPDAVIGGRSVDLIAVDGKTGKTLWAVAKTPDRAMWGNFYSCQVIDDINGDGVADLVNANGGDQARDNNRQPGFLLVISGKTGDVLRKMVLPEQKESYMSPLVVSSPQTGEKMVIFGTGGETVPGDLWEIPLTALLAEDAKGFTRLVSSPTKGFEAPPASADFNTDGIPDYLIQGFDGTVTVIDGQSNQIIWEVKNPGFESISQATPGYFVGNDAIPDVFAQISQGVFPAYNSSKQLLIDGASGAVVWSSSTGKSASSGSVAVDLNGDGIDEVIFSVISTIEETGTNMTSFYLLDTTTKTSTLWHTNKRFTIAAPWVGDMDNDGKIDIILESNAGDTTESPTLNRYELEAKTPQNISWGAYLGTKYDGAFPQR